MTVRELRRYRLLLFLLLVVCLPAGRGRLLHATTRQAATCNRADVAAQIALSSAGDTVVIPPGTCTWSTELDITVAITLIGAGIDQTILIDNVPKPGRIIVEAVGSQYFRLSGFTMQGQATDPANNNKYHIHVDSSSTTSGFRIDHLKLTHLETGGIEIQGGWGLVDHVQIFKDGHAGYQNGISVRHDNWNGDTSTFGDRSWADDDYFGSEKFVFIEDSIVQDDIGGTGDGGFGDCHHGGRMVIRHNQIIKGSINTHGTDTDGRPRGCRAWEIYNNDFVTNVERFIMGDIRSGTGVFHDNTIGCRAGSPVAICAGHAGDANYALYDFDMRLITYRDFNSSPKWGGLCNGSSGYDQNSPGGTGYRCVDQPGSGRSNLVSGDPVSPVAWPANINDPAYSWANTWSGHTNANFCGCGATTNHVASGRDYFNNTVKAGYTTYTYPHPLQGGGSGNQAPTVAITAPTTAATYETSTTPITTVAGTAADNDGSVASVTWTNNQGGSGTATGTSNWTIPTITLTANKINVITVTATDNQGLAGTPATLQIFYVPVATGNADDFNRDAWATLGPNWQNPVASVISGFNNEATATTVADYLAFWNAHALANNQCAQVTVRNAATVAPFVNDTFTGASGSNLLTHVGETGATWTKVATDPASPLILSNANRIREGTDNGYARYLASGAPTNADYQVTANFHTFDLSGGYVGMILRGQADGSGYFAGYWPTGQFYFIDRQIPGDYRSVATSSGSPVAWATGSDHQLVFRVQGSTLTLTDGAFTLSGTNTDVSAVGKAGVMHFEGSSTDTTGIHMSDVQAANLSPSLVGVVVRGSVTAGLFSGYVALTDGTGGAGHTYLYKVNNGAATVLGNSGTGVATGHQLKLCHDGANLTMSDNGSTIVGPVADVTVASGKPGIYLNGVGPRLDDATFSETGGADTTPPTVVITLPTTDPTYPTFTSPLTSLAGTCTDNVGVASVTWANDRGGSGTATGTTNWTVASITLQFGDNVITMTCSDTAGSPNTSTDQITVNYSAVAPKKRVHAYKFG